MDWIKRVAKFTVGFVLFLFFGLTIVSWGMNFYDKGDLVEEIKNGNISSVYVETRKDVYRLNQDEVGEIVDEIRAMEWLWSGKNRGESWLGYCYLNFKPESRSLIYRLELRTSESMDGQVMAELQLVSGDTTQFYFDYNGNKLLKSLKDISNDLCVQGSL